MHASSVKAAEDLLQAREYAGAVSLCGEALEVDPDNLDLRILRARALMALRRDEEAKRELGRVLRWHSPSAEAYRLLGELAIRSGKLEAAETFLRHAVRLDPEHSGVAALLDLVQSSNQPTVAVEKLPAATATVGCTLSGNGSVHPGAVDIDHDTLHVDADPEEADDADGAPTVEADAAVIDRFNEAPGSVIDFADFAASVDHRDDPTEQVLNDAHGDNAGVGVASDFGGDRAPPPAGRVADRFGGYLVDIGALTPIQLRAALDYHRRIGVRVGAAAVALGFLTEPRVEWAAHDYHVHRNDP